MEPIDLQNIWKKLKVKRSPIRKMNGISGRRGGIEKNSTNMINIIHT